MSSSNRKKAISFFYSHWSVKQISLLSQKSDKRQEAVRQQKQSFLKKKYLVLSLPLLDVCVINWVIFFFKAIQNVF